MATNWEPGQVKNVCGGFCDAMARGTIYHILPYTMEEVDKVTTLHGQEILAIFGKLPAMTLRDIQALADYDRVLDKQGTYYKDLLHKVSGSTKIQMRANTLPIPPEESASPWINLFNNPLWIDERDYGYSVYLEEVHPSKEELKRIRVNLPRRSKQLKKAVGFFRVIPFYTSKVPGGKRAYVSFSSVLTETYVVMTSFDYPDNFRLTTIEDIYSNLLKTENDLLMGVVEAITHVSLQTLYFVNGVGNSQLVKVAPSYRVPKYQADYPKFEYTTLGVKQSNGTISPCLDIQLRKSPRLHLRRGHIRKYTNQHTWIKPMMVGLHQHGVIAKDYTANV